MRQVYIDLTSRTTRSSMGDFVGYLGEHNATELLITIPQEMVNESDYQVVVFQAGPMVFRTRRITEDRTNSTYRDGNTIHTKLTRSLTKISPLGLQVECYKEGDNGDAILIGKTQTVPHLVLKPSPEGFPGYGYDGSFEDIEKAIEYAHKHSNAEVLSGFAVNDNDDLTFNGTPITGIARYDNPSSLPETADIGAIALAVNDDPDPEPERITTGKEYKALKLKDHIALEDFSETRYVVGDSTSSEVEAGFELRCGNESLGTLILFHAPSRNMSFMAFIDSGTIKSARIVYSEDALFIDNSGGAYMFFNPYKEFDFGELASLADPAIIPLGWGFLYTQRCNPTINQSMYVDTEMRALVNQDKYWFENYHLPYENVTIYPESTSFNKEHSENMLSAVFEVVGEKPKTKGLYIFTENGWESINSLAKSRPLVVNSVRDLPLDAETGTMAYVTNNAYLFTEEHFNLYKNNTYTHFYLPPAYDDCALLYDFNLVIEMWRHLDNGDAKYGDAINIVTNKDSKYFVLEASSTKYPYNRHLIYSWEDQTITYNGSLEFEVKKGWNELTPYYSPNTVKQLSFEELPEFDCSHSGSSIPPYYKVITMDVPAYGTRNWIPMYHFGDDPYGEIDNGKGLWVKTDMDWVKIMNTEQYILEED